MQFFYQIVNKIVPKINEKKSNFVQKKEKEKNPKPYLKSVFLIILGNCQKCHFWQTIGKLK